MATVEIERRTKIEAIERKSRTNIEIKVATTSENNKRCR